MKDRNRSDVGGFRRPGSGIASLAADIHDVLQLFAGFEIRNFLRGNLDAGTGFRIQPDARLALTGAETAETANLDLIAAAKRAHDTVEDRFHDDFGFLPGHLDNSRDLFNQIGFGHRPPLVSLPNSTV